MRQHRYISILVVVILTVAIACLAGCGKKDTESDTDAKATETSSQEKKAASKKAENAKNNAKKSETKTGYKNKVIHRLSKTKWIGDDKSEYSRVNFSGTQFTMHTDSGATMVGNITLNDDCTAAELAINGGETLHLTFKMTQDAIYFDDNKMEAQTKLGDNWE